MSNSELLEASTIHASSSILLPLRTSTSTIISIISLLDLRRPGFLESSTRDDNLSCASPSHTGRSGVAQGRSRFGEPLNLSLTACQRL